MTTNHTFESRIKVSGWHPTRARLDDRIERLGIAKQNLFSELAASVREFSSGLVSPKQQLSYKHEKLLATSRAWSRGLAIVIKQKFNELEKVNLILEGVSYQKILDRGFSLVTDQNGKTVSAVDTAPGMLLDVLFRDGCVRAKVETESVTKPRSRKYSKSKIPTKLVDDDPQGSLI